MLDTIVPNIKKTADLVQEIAAASTEQTSGVGEFNSAVPQMSQTTQQAFPAEVVITADLFRSYAAGGGVHFRAQVRGTRCPYRLPAKDACLLRFNPCRGHHVAYRRPQ